METLDLRKLHKPLYSAKAGVVAVLEIPELTWLMIDGAIEPGLAPGNSPLFSAQVSALYGLAYTLKFMMKKRSMQPVDYPVMPLEGRWTIREGETAYVRKDQLIYTLMILQPDWIDGDLFAQGLDALRRKKGDSPALAQLRLERFAPGKCLQTLHIGPYDSEPATFTLLEAYAERENLALEPWHYEIYLSPPGGDPARQKTILRKPVQPRG